MVLLVVQPVDHRGVPGQLDQQVPEAPHAVGAKQLHLDGHVEGTADLVGPGREHVMPEEGHLLLKRPPGVAEAVHPVQGRLLVEVAELGPWVVPVEEGLVQRGLRLRVEELIDSLLVSLLGQRFDLLAVGAEPRPAHEMRHKRDIPSVSHPTPPHSGPCASLFIPGLALFAEAP